MKDKELLELAAKAAGITYKYYSDPEGLIINDDQWPLVVWNPLTDDGDALRLAVKLRIEIAFSEDTDGEEMAVAQYGKWSWRGVCMEQDPYAATRRAIVRAAAEIGKNMLAAAPEYKP